MDRRNLLKLGGVTAGTFACGGMLSDMFAADENHQGAVWKYHSLDPVLIGPRVYELYDDGGCMYASFRAIVEQVGQAWEKEDPAMAQRILSFPFAMMKYGKGGIRDRGSLCGAVNGCSAVVGLFVADLKEASKLINEVCEYYFLEPLPHFIPEKTKETEIAPCVSESLLCNLSSSKWCKEASVEKASPLRSERCRRLTVDTAIKTVELLNEFYE